MVLAVSGYVISHKPRVTDSVIGPAVFWELECSLVLELMPERGPTRLQVDAWKWASAGRV